MRTLRGQWNRFAVLVSAGVTMAILIGAVFVWGQTPQLGLTIASIGPLYATIDPLDGVLLQ